MWHSLEILIIFNTFTLKQLFWKTKTFFKRLEYHFLVKALRLKTQHFHTNLPCQKWMLRHIQNGRIMKNGVLAVAAAFFWKFCFILRTFYKELIWCTNYRMPIYLLFEYAGDLFEVTVSLWVSLNNVVN